MASKRLLEALQVTAQACRADWSEPTFDVVIKVLEKYPEAAVLQALHRCMMELKFLSLADILARIEDGRPGVEEAWGMLPRNEESSVVWCEEMQEGWAAARPLLAEGDMIAARMAFKERYSKLCADARAQRKPARWSPSLGTDKTLHEAVLTEAVDRHRLTAQQAAALLPNAMVAPEGQLQIAGPADIPDSAEFMRRIRKLTQIVVKDAPIEVKAAAVLRQQKVERTQEEQLAHEARVKQQLEELKKRGET